MNSVKTDEIDDTGPKKLLKYERGVNQQIGQNRQNRQNRYN